MKKDFSIHKTFFFINLMLTTHTHTHTHTTYNFKKRGNKGRTYGIPPNRTNRQKHSGKETMEALSYQKAKDKMAIGNPHTSIMTLNVNRLNSPKKRYIVADWVQKQNPTICCLQETHLSCKDKDSLKVKGWKLILQANRIHRKAGALILISENNRSQDSNDKDRHFTMIKGTLPQNVIKCVVLFLFRVLKTPDQINVKNNKQGLFTDILQR